MFFHFCERSCNLHSISFLKQGTRVVFLVSLQDQHLCHVLVQIRVFQFDGFIGFSSVLVVVAVKVAHGFIIRPAVHP